MPLLEDVLDQLALSSSFTTLDLSQGYLQLAIEPGSRHLVSFATGAGIFQFTRLPFGLRNACAIFNRTLRSAECAAGLKDIVAGYFDDLTVHTLAGSPSIHIAAVERVFNFLDRFHLKLNLSKCCFGEPSIRVLGHVVDAQGLTVDPTKLQGVANMPQPTTKKGLQSFVGFANYYRSFIPSFSDIAAPLTALAAVGTSGAEDITEAWHAEHQQAFEQLKSALLSTSVLKLFDYTNGLPLRLETDASDIGVGAILYQQDSQGKYRPVSYLSRKLSKAERNYNVTERELLAITFGVSKLSSYLADHECDVYTDHGALTHLMNSSLLPSARLKRWMIALSAFRLTIYHRPGAQNDAADCLSRLPPDFRADVTLGSVPPLERPAMFLATFPQSDGEDSTDGPFGVFVSRVADSPAMAMTAVREVPTFVFTRSMATVRRFPQPEAPSEPPSPPPPEKSPDQLMEVAASEAPLAGMTPAAEPVPDPPAGEFEEQDDFEDVPPPSLRRSFSSTIVLPARPTPEEEEAEDCRLRSIYEKRDPYRNPDLLHLIRTGQHTEVMMSRTAKERSSLERVAQPYKWHATSEMTYEEGGSSPLQKSWLLPLVAQRPEFIRRAHELAHFGISATLYRIRDLPFGAAYWPGMQMDVTRFVRECATCLQYSNAPPMQSLARASQVPGIFDEVAIDLLTGLPQSTGGYTGLFVITEYLSRFPFAYPIRGKTAEESAACLMHYIALFGAPRVIRSDNGGEFVNKLVDALFH